MEWVDGPFGTVNIPAMNRIVYTLAGAAAAAVALVPLSALAAASPTPSPGLETVLAPPPSGFVELTTSSFNGHFNAHQYAATSTAQASQIENTLNHDGMVDGYGKTWLQRSASHALLEVVIAFTGGKGASDWLTQAEAGDKSDPSYVHSDTMSGLDHYYGGHFSYTSSSTVGDAFVFAKGNDVYEIGAVSAKDDVLNLAMSQTTAQFNAAPNETIPSSQWPENKNSLTGGGGGIGAIFYVLAAVVVIAVIVLVVVLRSRGRGPAMAAATYAPPPMSGAYAGGGGSPPTFAQAAGVPAGVQLSEDGRYWWDGQTWKDAEHEAPPSAQRSSDGTLWWDGKNWRPVPQGGPPPSSSPF